jgi:metallo-beta-lactamase class B
MKWNGLGNLADAVVDEWEGSVQRVKESFPNAKIVVPGHDEYGGLELLDHTIELVKKYKKQK